MNARTIVKKEEKLHLKLIKNKSNGKNTMMKKLRINTLTPGFSSLNSSGNKVSPTDFNLL